jgi:hypothetical protein
MIWLIGFLWVKALTKAMVTLKIWSKSFAEFENDLAQNSQNPAD